MNKEKIEEYLKRIDELGTKLTGEDKETYAWLIQGFNQCAKWLNETEQQCEKQKEVIDKINQYIQNSSLEVATKEYGMLTVCDSDELLSILEDKEV